jgi:amidohydrolase
MALAALGEAAGGSLVVLGTPAEEGTVPQAGGKVHLAEAGAFGDLDAALMFHFGDRTVLRTPLLARESLVLTFHGRAAHASGSPEAGLNALEAAVLFFNAVNALRQHLTADVRVHGIISRGGESANTVPDLTEVKLNVRAETLASLTTVVERVKDCARGAALATGTRVEFAQWAKTYADFLADPKLLHLIGRNLTALGVEWQEAGTAKFSSDIGTVSHLIPCAHPYLAIVPEGVPGHSAAFCQAAASTEGQAAMRLAAKVLAFTALDLFHSGQSSGIAGGGSL